MLTQLWLAPLHLHLSAREKFVGVNGNVTQLQLQSGTVYIASNISCFSPFKRLLKTEDSDRAYTVNDMPALAILHIDVNDSIRPFYRSTASYHGKIRPTITN